MADQERQIDPEVRVDALTESILGRPLTLTGREVELRTGIPAERIAAWWRALGYPELSADNVAYTRDDLDFLKSAERLIDRGGVDMASQEAFMRTVGRTFSRLAEWQARAMVYSVFDPDSGALTTQASRELSEMLKLGSRIQDGIWRRHLVGATARFLLKSGPASDAEVGCAGFVDIVGYTGRSRTMSYTELSALVGRFEGVVSDLIAEHQGRVVKTIGDEIFFVVDDPVEAAWLGVELAEQHRNDAEFPDVRVGMAHGELFNRLGDVLGPVVNLASRLTSVARPGRVVVDSSMADLIKDSSGLRVRRMRRVSMKGLDAVQPWSLALIRDDRRAGLRGTLGEMLEGATDELATRLPPRGD